MPIVTDGLVAYYNSKQGINGNTWSNIAPATVGSHNGAITGATVQPTGMYFDGVNDKVVMALPPALLTPTPFTLEYRVKIENIDAFPDVICTNSDVITYHDSNAIYIYLNDSVTGSIYNTSGGLSGISQSRSLTLVYDLVKLYFYVDGVLSFAKNTGSANLKLGGTGSTNLILGTNTDFYPKGIIDNVRLYSRALTAQEVAQNFAVGSEIGIGTAPTPLPPIVSSIIVNKQKISDEIGMNQSIITIRFDKDVTQYVARLNGVDYNTGVVVHSGGAVLANTDAQVIIDWNELSSEGQNRINIYGQNADGWTPPS